MNKCIFSEETFDGKPRIKKIKKGNSFHRKFYDNSLFRFYLYHKFNNNNGDNITVVLMNPSYADETGLDGTLNNVKNLLNEKYSKIYSSFEVLNLFPIRNPENNELKAYLEKHDPQSINQNENKKIIEKYLKKSNNVILAWGSDYHNDAKWFFPLLKNKKLYVFYKLNEDSTPKHFSPRIFNDKNIKDDDKVLREAEIDIKTCTIKLKNKI